MKNFIVLIKLVWKERNNKNCRAKYRRIAKAMNKEGE